MSSQLAATSMLLTGVLLVGQYAPLCHSQEVNPDTFTSAEVCGECHQAIHAVWQHSMHSRAFRNGVFQAAYREAKKATSTERSRLCLNCHAPTVQKTQDYAAESPLTSEGVTCDFCHSIREVTIKQAEVQADLKLGRIKFGPLKHAQSPAHVVVESELHRRSELCATCHEYRNEHGVAVLETYSEWKASPYAAQGTQCQDCHMPLVAGRVAAVPGKDTSREQVNLHDISGSHDLEKVRQAVSMKLLSSTWVGEKRVLVRVRVSNEGSGHRFPTGLPMHRAVLEVRLTDRGRPVGARTLGFEKVLTDETGVPVAREYEAFFNARAIRTDTRLNPKESRIVSVTFSDVDTPEGQVEASLWYEYSTRTVMLEQGVETIKPVQMKFLLASDSQRLPHPRRWP